jgi:hypothetical protein
MCVLVESLLITHCRTANPKLLNSWKEASELSRGDIQILSMILEAATRFDGPLSENEMNAIVDEYSMQPI